MSAKTGGLARNQDAFGQGFRAFRKGLASGVVVEREDGCFFVDPCAQYFAAFAAWPAVERRAIRLSRGRVLDIGCGAGRHSLHLQDQGLDVLAIDASPLSVGLCKARGLRDVRTLSVGQVTRELGEFDTILMMGINFGLFGDVRNARRLLKRFHGLTSAGARIIASSISARAVSRDAEYRRFLRARGRLPGQVRMRIRHKKAVTPWFHYLMVSAREMASIVRGTGWKVQRTYSTTPTEHYVAILTKS